jgi:hypothetical protein
MTRIFGETPSLFLPWNQPPCGPNADEKSSPGNESDGEVFSRESACVMEPRRAGQAYATGIENLEGLYGYALPARLNFFRPE